MNKTKLFGAILLTLGMTADALADNDFYAGASAGQATIDACDGVANCDDEDTSWKVFGGWELNPNLAFEAGFVDFGVSDDGTDLLYGIGAQYMFTNQFGIVGEWEWYDIESDVDLYSVGLLFKF